MLEKLFTSKTRYKVLYLLMFNSDKTFHLRELAKIINVTPIYLAKELNNLISLNLVINTKKGNLSLYKINKNNIYLIDLKNMFIKTDYVGEAIKQKLQNRVKFCLIYGSFAKSIESSKSDIDILVISDEIKEKELLNIISDLENIIKREINYILWNTKTFYLKAKDNHLLKTINKDKIIMLIGNENEFRKNIR